VCTPPCRALPHVDGIQSILSCCTLSTACYQCCWSTACVCIRSHCTISTIRQACTLLLAEQLAALHLTCRTAQTAHCTMHNARCAEPHTAYCTMHTAHCMMRRASQVYGQTVTSSCPATSVDGVQHMPVSGATAATIRQACISTSCTTPHVPHRTNCTLRNAQCTLRRASTCTLHTARCAGPHRCMGRRSQARSHWRACPQVGDLPRPGPERQHCAAAVPAHNTLRHLR
jgi:hypothetical protein